MTPIPASLDAVRWAAVLGVRKPERRIYTRALGRFGLEAGNAFFVDDSAANVRGAAAVGIYAFHLTSTGPGHYNTDELLEAMRAFAER